MFNIQQFNEEREGEFDEQFKSSYAYPFVFDETCNNDVKSFLTESHTLLLKRFLEKEIERLELEVEKETTLNGSDNAYTHALDDTVEYYKSLIDTL